VRVCIAIVSLALLLIISPRASAQTLAKQSLSLDGAKLVIAAAKAKATAIQAPSGTFAVVDEGGNLLALERLDGTFAASANVSIGKARTAALFKKPTKFFEEVVNKGRTTMVTLNDFTPLQGGVPIMMDGNIVGAIGVSGAASADQDEELAQAAAAAFTEIPTTDSPNHVVSKPPIESDNMFVHIGHESVAQAFAKGMPLVENDQYKIHASRRTEPGTAEVHDDETDIVYVVAGSATLVTGGSVVDPKLTAPGQTRGSAIVGGQTTRVSVGDVFVVPAGMPHWFQQVDGPFQYFVVKPISQRGESK